MRKKYQERTKKHQEAALVWLKQNPGKSLDDCTYKEIVTLEDGQLIKLGRYFTEIRGRYKAMQLGQDDVYYGPLTESEISWWNEHGFSWNLLESRRKKYQEAALIWLKEHPQKTINDCVQREKVMLESGEIIGLGAYLNRIRAGYRTVKQGKKLVRLPDLTEEEITWWNILGMSWEPEVNSKQKYRQAALVWLDKNPGKTLKDCAYCEEVTLKSGEIIKIGEYLSRLRSGFNAIQKGKKPSSCSYLSKEDIAWWDEHGMVWRTTRGAKKDYRKAALVWLDKNPGKVLANCPQTTIVTLEDGEIIHLGNYISLIRAIYKSMKKGEKFYKYKDLTKEEIDWWTEHGMSWEAVVRKKKDYRKAALVWLKQNPDKTIANCPQSTKVTLDDGEVVSLGSYLNRMKMTYSAMQCDETYGTNQSLTEEEIVWWSNLGMNWNCSYRNSTQRHKRAAVIWLQQNPGKTLADCSIGTEVTLENGNTVNLGKYLESLKDIYRRIHRCEPYNGRRLTSDEIHWWEEHGINWGIQKSSVSVQKGFSRKSKSTVALSHSKEDLKIDSPEDWLLDIYNQIIRRFNYDKMQDSETFMRIAKEIMKTYLLTSAEEKFLYQSFKKYLLNVKDKGIKKVGNTQNEEQKIEGIFKYGLDEFDIEESFFVSPLQTKNALLREKYEILRGYIIDWNYYSQEEKDLIQQQNKFSPKDMKYIEDKRKDIDRLVQKVKKLRKQK